MYIEYFTYPPTFLFSESLRNFKKNMKMGRFNEENMAKRDKALVQKEEEEKAASALITVGKRCQVQVAGHPTKIGTVMFVGMCFYFFPYDQKNCIWCSGELVLHTCFA